MQQPHPRQAGRSLVAGLRACSGEGARPFPAPGTISLALLCHPLRSILFFSLFYLVPAPVKVHCRCPLRPWGKGEPLILTLPRNR